MQWLFRTLTLSKGQDLAIASPQKDVETSLAVCGASGLQRLIHCRNISLPLHLLDMLICPGLLLPAGESSTDSRFRSFSILHFLDVMSEALQN